MDELGERLSTLCGWLRGSEDATYRSLGVFDEAIADGDSGAIVEAIVRRRRVALSDGTAKRESGGKLLLLYLDENLMDGAAAVASKGFFGGLNFPPCDLWLAVVQNLSRYGGSEKRTLISWIPDPAIAEAQAGIEVNPEECLEWASEGAPILCELEQR